MADKYYTLKDNNLRIFQVTELTQCSGHDKYTLAADAGEFIVEFPFDSEGNNTGYPYQIPLPAHVIEKHFDEVKSKGATAKK